MKRLRLDSESEAPTRRKIKRPSFDDDPAPPVTKKKIARPSFDDDKNLKIKRPELDSFVLNQDGVKIKQVKLEWPPKVDLNRNPYAVRACVKCGKLYGKPCDGKDRLCGNRWYVFARVEKGMEKSAAADWANKKVDKEKEKEND